MYLTVCYVAWVHFPAVAEYFEGSFPGILCQPNLSQRGRKWLNLPSNFTTKIVEIEEEGRSLDTDNG